MGNRPTGSHSHRQSRNREIFAKWQARGGGIPALSVEYGLSVRSIYRILKDCLSQRRLSAWPYQVDPEQLAKLQAHHKEPAPD